MYHVHSRTHKYHDNDDDNPQVHIRGEDDNSQDHVRGEDDIADPLT